MAGPISDIDIKDAAGWREKAQKELESAGIQVFNPLRDKDLSDPHIKTNLNYKEVVERDMEDIAKCDIFLTDMRTEARLIGTAIELVHAKVWEKEIVVFGEAYRDRYWLRYHVDSFFNSLDEAIKHIKKMSL